MSAQDARKAGAEAADEYQHALKTNTEDIAKEQATKRTEAKGKGIEAQREHSAGVEDTKAANEAALRKQSKIAPTKENWS